MKKTVWTFGLISGAILSAMMAITMPLVGRISYYGSMVIGYTTMVLAFLLVYFGVRSYRDNVAGGTVRFGRAFAVGMLIALISSVCYVATWELIYFKLSPDYATKFRAHADAQALAGGGTAEEIAKRRAEQQKMWDLYDKPAYNAAMTLVEPLPVGLLFALVSAGILSRGRRTEVAGLAASAG
jgi:glucan phosphoethanolaminetransferase (alkaline phosphatase superfamily)